MDIWQRLRKEIDAAHLGKFMFGKIIAHDIGIEERNKEIILSVLINAIKYERGYISVLQGAADRCDDLDNDFKDITFPLIASKRWFTEVQNAFKWLWLEWRGKSIALEIVNGCEPDTSLGILTDIYSEMIDPNELDALTLKLE